MDKIIKNIYIRSKYQCNFESFKYYLLNYGLYIKIYPIIKSKFDWEDNFWISNIDIYYEPELKSIYNKIKELEESDIIFYSLSSKNNIDIKFIKYLLKFKVKSIRINFICSPDSNNNEILLNKNELKSILNG